jgi:hypothetical protein
MMHPTQEDWMDYLYEDVEPHRKAELAEHLQECQACRDEVEQWRSTMSELEKWEVAEGRKRRVHVGRAMLRAARWAAAAVILVGVGAGVSQFLSAKPVDVEQLREEVASSVRTELEPKLRENLRTELTRNWEVALQQVYLQLKQETQEESQRGMNEFAVQTFEATQYMTNEQLAELVDSINASQRHDRIWMVSALEQTEKRRQAEDNLLRSDFEILAARTNDKLQRIQEGIAQLLHVNQDFELKPEGENELPMKERSPK